MAPCSPDCPVCGGLGYVRLPFTDINDPHFGKLYPCPEGLKTTWDPMLGIDEAESNNLNWSLFQPSQAMIIMQKALTDLLSQGYGWLYLWGAPGLGKSVAVKTTAIEAHYRYHKQAKYITHTRLINFLRDSYGDDNGQAVYTSRLETLANLDFLAIDEVGRDRSTEFGISAFSDLLDRRYISAINRQSITVFISNFPPEKVLDSYQKDRVDDGRFTILNVQGNSMRSAMAYPKQLPKEEVPWWQKF